jgi:hypothetical protein
MSQTPFPKSALGAPKGSGSNILSRRLRIKLPLLNPWPNKTRLIPAQRGWFHASRKTSARAFLSGGVDSGATRSIESIAAEILHRVNIPVMERGRESGWIQQSGKRR